MIIKAYETAKESIISANSNIVNYPVSNVVNSILTKIYRTDSNTTAEIVFDALAPINVSSISIANHNISESLSTIILQGNATDVWTSPSFEKTLTWDEDIITDFFTEELYRYWRVQIIDSLNPNGYIKIGRIWIGQGYRTPGIEVLVVHDRNSASVGSKSVSGHSYMDKRYLYSNVKTKFPNLTEEANNTILDIFETVDVGIPFFITFDKGGSILKTLYVTMDNSSLKSTPLGNRNLYTIGVNYREEV